MKIVHESNDFRIYETESVKHNGKLIKMTLCEELIEGRWEGFYSLGKVVQ